MPGGPYILFADDEFWRITSPGATDEMRFDREVGAKQIASALAAKLRARGYQGEGTLLALPAAWCLSAVISIADLPRQDRAAMAFRLEEKLPLAAENFTADFALFADSALAVCVPNDKARSLVESLEEAGVVIQSVTPAVMLAGQEMTRGNRIKGNMPALFVWGEGEQANVICLENNAPTAWALVQEDPSSLAMQIDLAQMELAAPVGISSCELSAATVSALQDQGHEISTRADTLEGSVGRIAPEILSGAISPWFELRRGVMAVEDSLRAVRRPINAALAAAAILCVVLAGAFIYRAVRYDRLAQAYESTLAEAFKQEFPGIAVPVNPQATLLSERKRRMLAGSSALPPEAQESALRIMHDVLAKLPADSTLSIDKMTFNDTSLQFEGKARVYEDIDALVAAARSAGMDVPTPQMRKNAGGRWNFLLRGSKSIKAPLATGAQ